MRMTDYYLIKSDGVSESLFLLLSASAADNAVADGSAKDRNYRKGTKDGKTGTNGITGCRHPACNIGTIGFICTSCKPQSKIIEAL